MKTVIILYLLVFLASAASADIYTWEDANGTNFTDDPSSIPQRYREQPPVASTLLSGTLHDRVGMSPQDRLAAAQETRAAERQANQAGHRRAVEVKRQQQKDTQNFQNTLQSLARFVVIWLLLGSFLFVVWVITLVDILRSEFQTPSGKAVWMLLVLFLPLLGMLIYMILGSHQKKSSRDYRERRSFGVACSVTPG